MKDLHLSGDSRWVDVPRFEGIVDSLQRIQRLLESDYSTMRYPAGRDPLPEAVGDFLYEVAASRVRATSLEASALRKAIRELNAGLGWVRIADRRPWLAGVAHLIQDRMLEGSVRRGQ